ncbi:DoxX family protein [Spirillospora albida]|uniref:DoxX family protein n=1 Tax=Spirillospora albida TaxID=58123 RepID=UPI00068FA0A6|nr:DoxX family protein [Spirillospora albida]
MIATMARDVALLVARICVGAVFAAHGWQKLVTNGIDGTAAFFDQAGVPLPTVSAWAAALIELVAGGALILGLAMPVAGLLLVFDMLGAYLFVHAGNGLFLDQGGAEFVMTLGAASLLLAVFGSGRFGIDHLLASRAHGRHGHHREHAMT